MLGSVAAPPGTIYIYVCTVLDYPVSQLVKHDPVTSYTARGAGVGDICRDLVQLVEYVGQKKEKTAKKETSSHFCKT